MLTDPALRLVQANPAATRILEELTGEPAFVVKVSGESLYRVRVGPVQGRTEAERLKSVIRAADYGTALILPH